LGVCEGFATGATILEDTGLATVVGFNSGNLAPIAEELRAKFAGLRFVVCADDDATVAGNPGMKGAVRAATILDCPLAVPCFGADRPAHASDFNVLHQHAGAIAVRVCIERATVQEPAQEQPERPKKKWHERVELNDFYAYMPMHNYIYTQPEIRGRRAASTHGFRRS
jgi:putative DNA primase/helicase